MILREILEIRNIEKVPKIKSRPGKNSKHEILNKY